MSGTPRRRSAALLAGLAALAAAAAGAAPATAASPRLVAFGSCEQLVAYARDHLPRPVPYDPDRPVPPIAPMPTTAAPQDSAREGGGVAGEDFSTTNVQEAGVDEPDIVKTDGTRIFAIAGDRFVEVDARADVPRVLGSLELDGSAHQLLLVGDRALVIGTTFDVAARMSLSVALPAPDRTVLTELDLSAPGSPRIVRTLRLDGQFRAARLSDGIVRLVTSSSPRALSEPSAAAAVAGWVPSYRLRNRRSGRVATRPLSACTQVRRPQEYAGLGLLTVLTIDLARGLAPVDSDSLLSDVGTVYGSRGALYVAAQTQSDPTAAADAAAPPATTLIHQFVATPGSQTHYRASGSVGGSLLSQWSLSEHAGVLRVASTVEPAFAGGFAPEPTDSPAQSESFVTTLAERDGRLAELGRVGGLGRGERIYAVRFIGDVGYVVTFRQVDPLYTLDLSDPRRPAVLGELKIPGYSAYLHPVGEDLLLGVGQDATSDGRRVGGQVSLFDVADLRAPKRLATLPLPGWSSEVEWDHHAFLYWDRSRLAVVPTGFGPDGETPGALGVRITRADGLRRAGDVRHPAAAPADDDELYSGMSQIRRSLVVGGRLFTLSEDGLLSSDLATLAGERWLPFPATP